MDTIIKLLKEIIEILNKYLVILDKPVEVPIEEVIKESTIESVAEPIIEETTEEVTEVTDYPDKESNKEPTPMAVTDLEPEVEPIEAPIQQTSEHSLYEIDTLVKEILEGKWGNGDARKANLEAAGYDYNAVQTKINELLQTQTKTYNGQLPTTKLVKTNAEVIADTIKWAVWIAGDNRFHYGGSRESNYNGHKNGCYFCGTNLKTKPKAMVDRERSYCCNPFIGAAWAHGGCIPTALKMCQNGKSWGFSKNNGYSTSKLFTNLGHPNKSKLKPGDVLCKDTHVAMYIGNGLLVEAAGHDDNKRNSTKWNNSIHTAKLTDSRYNGFSRVHRFNGSVNTDTYIRHGEVSKRVAQWQAFLDWYFDGKVGSADGIYGDNTLKWTKKFQEEQIGPGQGDGIIGQKTLDAAAKVKK